MECILAYLLLAVVVDLIFWIINYGGTKHEQPTIHRRLWSDSLFDCTSKAFAKVPSGPRQPFQAKPNRYRT